MRRFFFDVAAKTYIQYDFHGREFADPNSAREVAEIIALDRECTDEDAQSGSEVQVRDVSGRWLFSIPVGEPDLVAA